MYKPIPAIPTYKINIYIGNTLHATTTVFSLNAVEQVVNHYTAQGYTTEVISEN